MTLHKYLYANVNPVSYTDPSGNFSLIEAQIVNELIGLHSSMVIQGSLDSLGLGLGFEGDLEGQETVYQVQKLIGLGTLGYSGFRIAGLFNKTARKVVSNCFKKNSFDGETLVHTETGLKPISDIKIGDRVWAFNEKTGEKSLQGNPPKKPPGSKVENSRNMTRGGSTCANRSLLTVRYWRS